MLQNRKKKRSYERRPRFWLLTGLLVILTVTFCCLGQIQESPWVWGPNLGAIGTDYVAISWYTSRPVGADLHYAKTEIVEKTGSWEETLIFEPHEGGAEIRLGDLASGTAYTYQVVLYEGDAIYACPVGTFMTASPEIQTFSFFVYGDTQSYPDRHKLVATAMLQDEVDAALIFHTGDLVESPTPERFRNFFWAIGDLARLHPYLTVLGNHERGAPAYYDFLALPPGGGEANEQWWSFDYGNIHFVGLDSTLLGHAGAATQMQAQMEWLEADLAETKALFKIIFFHQPLYTSAAAGGVNEELRALWEPLFIEHNVDVVFCGHVHCYEHLYRNGIHHIVTGGGGAPLEPPIEEAAEGTVSRRYGMLHYMRVMVDGSTLRVEAIPVASVIDEEIMPVPSGRSIDAFTVTKHPVERR
jgi:3',5'-cyclic AMP phosphodiesterase CpdA